MNEFLMIEAATDNANSNPKVMGLAYSGGKMNLPGWKHPVVVDLAGLQLPDNVPLLTNHENRTTSRVGQVTAKIEDGSLMIEGEITSTSGTASVLGGTLMRDTVQSVSSAGNSLNLQLRHSGAVPYDIVKAFN